MALDPFTAALDFGRTIADKLFPNAEDADRRAVAERVAIIMGEYGQAKEQSRVNAVEARTASLFIAGWRPAIGWTCAIALAFNFLVVPLLMWLVAVTGTAIEIPEPPRLVSDGLFELIMGMLGLGAMRTYEKVNGVPPTIIVRSSKNPAEQTVPSRPQSETPGPSPTPARASGPQTPATPAVSVPSPRRAPPAPWRSSGELG